MMQENDGVSEGIALSEVPGVCSELERLGKGRLGCQLDSIWHLFRKHNFSYFFCIVLPSPKMTTK